MSQNFPLITLCSDFGVQTQGIGAMEAVAFSIAPTVRLIHLMHGLPSFNVRAAARTLETLDCFPIGVHVCVCDPGVGTKRKALAIKVGRGDILIGPDNGVLLPATERLGGSKEIREITNYKLCRDPISPIFHGRDLFTPVAAHLANGLTFSEVGPLLEKEALHCSPYTEATLEDRTFRAEVIQINHFGSLHLNISHQSWDKSAVDENSTIYLTPENGERIKLSLARTFGDVPPGQNLILKDDYGRIEIAINLGNFSKQYGISIGAKVDLTIA